MRSHRSKGPMAALAVFALVAAACSNSSSSTPASGSAGSGGTNDLLASIMAKGQLTVATDPKYPPQSKLNVTTNQWEGFDVDVANEVSKRLGLTQPVSFVTPSWTTITSGNWNGRWNLSVGSMTITTERSKVLDFTGPYYFTPAGFAVYNTNTSITSATDLTGKAVGTCGGCTYEEYLRGTLSIPGYPVQFAITGATVKTYDTDTTAIQDLSKGDCVVLCAAFSAIPTLQAAIDAGSQIKVVGDPLYYEPLALAVDKESTLDPTSFAKKVTDIIQQMHDDGTLTQLSCKWYHVDLSVADPGQAKAC